MLLLPFAVIPLLLAVDPCAPAQEAQEAQEAQAAQETPKAPAKIELERFVDPSGHEALRGVVRIHEDREHGTGKLLELDLVVLLATGPDPRPDPVFVFAGGPGGAVTRSQAGYLSWWGRAQRDIVLVDQRGTNGNHALRCASGRGDVQAYLDPLMSREACRACVQELSQEADLRLYSTPIAMDDVDEVRELLGYERINLRGGSYGTRAALVYMRRHPERVRTATLNGVAPIAFTNPLFHAQEAQLGLERVLEECAAHPDCSEAYPALAVELAALFARLAEGPVTVEVENARTGEPVELRLSRDAFAEALRVMLYYMPTNRQVPYLVHRAHQGDFAPFVRRGIESNRSLRNYIALGMLFSVTCAEDVARIDPETIEATTRDTFLGDVRVRAQKAVCEFWPHAELPEGYGEPVSVDVPTLLLSGTHDPVTSPRWGAEAARHLPNSLHLVVPGCHGVGGPCIASIEREFLERAAVQGLDTSCVESMRMPAFRLE